MTRTELQTQKLFDAWAKSYDADLADATGILLGYQQSLQAVDAAIPADALDATSAHLLDIGIGSGAVAARFAERVGVVSGIDISEEMLAICKQKHPRFLLQTGVFHAIPAQAATYDCVVSGFAYHETPVAQRQNACLEVARVLKSEGYLCLLDIMFASEAAMLAARELIANEWDDSEVYALVGDLDQMLRVAGFVSISWRQTAPFHWMVSARKP